MQPKDSAGQEQGSGPICIFMHLQADLLHKIRQNSQVQELLAALLSQSEFTIFKVKSKSVLVNFMYLFLSLIETDDIKSNKKKKEKKWGGKGIFVRFGRYLVFIIQLIIQENDQNSSMIHFRSKLNVHSFKCSLECICPAPMLLQGTSFPVGAALLAVNVVRQCIIACASSHTQYSIVQMRINGWGLFMWKRVGVGERLTFFFYS